MTVKKCTLCDCTLTDFNVTKEHIIPNAIGGRKKVIGFICLTCNSESGSGWDGELTKEIEPLSLLIGISRQRGNVPPQEFSTAGGESVQVKVDGTWTIGKPRVTESRDENITRIHIRARDKSDYLRILKGLRKKYPQLRDRDDLMASYRESSYYSDDPIGIELPYCLGQSKAERSLVKSALALTFDAGVDPRQGDLALGLPRE